MLPGIALFFAFCTHLIRIRHFRGIWQLFVLAGSVCPSFSSSINDQQTLQLASG